MDDSTLHTLTISSVDHDTHDDAESPASVHSVPLHIPLSPIPKVADDSDTDGSPSYMDCRRYINWRSLSDQLYPS